MAAEQKKRAAILGASGYTGAECVRLLSAHPLIEIAALTTHSRAGQDFAQIYPNFASLSLPALSLIDAVDWDNIDVAFACLPHGASQETIAQIYDKVETIVDLSADFRLSNPDIYRAYYGRAHDNPELLKARIYGLTEFSRDSLKGAKLIACPGCYPTASLLALLPALKGGFVSSAPIIIDAKSGVTGAGRKNMQALNYAEITDGAHAYAIGSHRHTPEIEQGLAEIGGMNIDVSFTPHLLPMNRGMIATCYVALESGKTVQDLRSHYRDYYTGEPFVHIMADDKVPQTRHVKASNHCHIGIFADRIKDRAIIISVIDNLTKGSSGQAVQNYNLSQGWDETLSLLGAPLFP